MIVLRLFKLQIIDGLFYKKQSNNNHIRERFILPKRGNIYDRNMLKIATSIIAYKAVYYVEKKTFDINDVKRILNILHRSENYNLQVLRMIKKQLSRSNRFSFVLARNLTNFEILRLKFNSVYFSKLDIVTYYLRDYVFKKATSALIGYVQGIKNRNDTIARLESDYKIGADGIEKLDEVGIGGRVGLNYDVIDVTGKKIDTILVNKPIDGHEVKTTIDQELQNKLSSYLEGKNGAATLIDVRTGEILSMVSKPNIDPNLLSIGISDDDWNEMLKQTSYDSGLFTNKNLTATYPPGSTFKIVSSLAGLIQGLDADKKYKCTGKHRIGNRTFHCWKDKNGGHGWVDLNMAIAQSCNCYFYNLSQQISNDDIYKVATLLGLGKCHLPDFKDEMTGLVGNSKWVKHKYGQIWMPGDNANLVLGQGWTHVTPIQLAVMVARLASGQMIVPRYLFQEKQVSFPSLGIQEEYLQKVRYGLFSVVNADYGLINGIVSKKYQVCGKTGSAQVVSERIENKDMRTGQVPIEKHSHALFVGFAPFNEPHYAVSVVVEHGIGGARSAAPIGTAILVNAIRNEQKHL